MNLHHAWSLRTLPPRSAGVDCGRPVPTSQTSSFRHESRRVEISRDMQVVTCTAQIHDQRLLLEPYCTCADAMFLAYSTCLRLVLSISHFPYCPCFSDTGRSVTPRLSHIRSNKLFVFSVYFVTLPMYIYRCLDVPR